MLCRNRPLITAAHARRPPVTRSPAMRDAQGSSGSCGTFGSPCLASGDEFKVQVLEVWQAGS